jgi:hypoxanthine-guanine phosphoribosyltransferase
MINNPIILSFVMSLLIICSVIWVQDNKIIDQGKRLKQLEEALSAYSRSEVIEGTTVQYKDVVGKNFLWNNNNIIVSDFIDTGETNNYRIIILNENQSFSINADSKSVFEAYKQHLKRN